MKFCIIGASGRMGQSLIRSCENNHDFEISSAIVRNDSSAIGLDSGIMSSIGENNIICSSDIEDGIKNCDVVIDFTTPGNTEYHLKLCEKYSKKIVIGTTGLDNSCNAIIEKYSKRIGIVYASNYSLGVNLMFKVCEIASKVLNDNGFKNIEVQDIHHVHKIDSPSGTALSIAKVITDSISSNDNVMFNVKREGEVIGYHNAVFSSDLEEFGLYHNAKNRDVFANGALVAGAWIFKNEFCDRIYDMTDVLNLNGFNKT